MNNYTYIYVINDRVNGANLGELEEHVLLTIAPLMEEAYSVTLCDGLFSRIPSLVSKKV